MTESQKEALGTFLDAWIEFDEARTAMNVKQQAVTEATTTSLTRNLAYARVKPTIVRDGKAYTMRVSSTGDCNVDGCNCKGEIE